MSSFNRIILVGRLTRDPEIKYTPQGTQLAKFSLAVNRIRSKNQEVDYFNIVAWQRLAEICGQYLRKGKLVLIEGRAQSRRYETQDGQKRTAFEIMAENMQMLGGRNDDYASQNQGASSYKQPPPKNTSPKIEDLNIDEIEVDEFDADDMPF